MSRYCSRQKSMTDIDCCHAVLLWTLKIRDPQSSKAGRYRSCQIAYTFHFGCSTVCTSPRSVKLVVSNSLLHHFTDTFHGPSRWSLYISHDQSHSYRLLVLGVSTFAFSLGFCTTGRIVLGVGVVKKISRVALTA
jgi:hypothetical protein